MAMNLERRSKIIDLINQKNTVTNQELMEIFNISIETVRRDLNYLEKAGVIEKVYGGAIKKNYLKVEPKYISREKENLKEKQAIAIETEKLISQNDSVFFDLGTTVFFVAENLASGKEINSFTNSLRTAMELSDKGVNVVLPGGELRNGEYSISGSIAESNMKNFNVDKAIIGVGGIDEKGVTDFIIKEASIRSQIIKNAQTVIAVADYSKFGVRAICNICDLSDIDILVTDNKAPKDFVKKIAKQGVKVIIAK